MSCRSCESSVYTALDVWFWTVKSGRVTPAKKEPGRREACRAVCIEGAWPRKERALRYAHNAVQTHTTRRARLHVAYEQRLATNLRRFYKLLWKMLQPISMLAFSFTLSLRARPLRPVFWIDELAAEAFAELHRVLGLSKAEDVHVDAVAVERMAALAQRQLLAEQTDSHVVASRAARGGKSDLVRPVTVDDVFTELSSTIDHAGHSLVVLTARAHATHQAFRPSRRVA
jgi:hypothetical protein